MLNLNTSHVKVNQCKTAVGNVMDSDLNTSHVKVNLGIPSSFSLV